MLYSQSTIQAEKDHYIAVHNGQHNYLTNASGTVLHYVHIIDKTTTRVVIGIGTYTKDGTTYIANVMAFIQVISKTCPNGWVFFCAPKKKD